MIFLRSTEIERANERSRSKTRFREMFILSPSRTAAFLRSQDPKRTSVLDRHPPPTTTNSARNSRVAGRLFMAEARVERWLAAILVARCGYFYILHNDIVHKNVRTGLTRHVAMRASI
jgi:hypothetical protein